MNAVVRAFAAIEVPDNLRQTLWEGTAQTRAIYPQGKWVSPGNLHLTVKFLGDIDQDQVPSIGACLDDVCRRHHPFTIVLGGVGTFPGGIRARVIWAGITSGGEETEHLAGDADQSLARLGFKPEDRPFRAHLTVARAGQVGVSDEVINALDRLRTMEWGRFAVERVVLMQSILRPQGPLYRALSHHPLRG